MILAVVLLLTGCASRGQPAAEAPSSGGDGAGGGSAASPTYSPREDPIDPPNAKQVTITGTFGADAVEGGCAYLQTDKATRYEVIYPKGWQLERGATQLRNPDGKIVATGGETITVRGQLATDMSICQIGPIFRATEVVTIDR